MRENETDPHESSYGDTFSELMDVLREDDDAGMITFEANLREIQTYLQNDYILAKKSLDYKELEDIENDLIEAWAHESDVATVSGRIYLLDPEAEDLIPDEWGDGLIDDRDDIYYLVDDVRLRSVAAQVLPMFDENGDLDDVKMVYTFAFTDDEDEMPVVSAYVGELFKHTYDQPTPHEAATRLESRWPAQFMLMQEWLHSGSNAQIVQSLRYLVQELQEQLAGSDQFRRLFECYIQSFVTLDKVLPYSISLDGSLDYFDGEGNPYAEDEKGEWLTFIVEGELSLLAYYPKFEMQTMSDGTVRATIIASTFNAEDGDEAEYVRLNVDTISSFRSTRAAASLLSKAIFHGERGSLIEAVSPGGEYDLSVYDTRDEATIELGAQDVVEGDEGVEQVPSKIEYLIAVEEAIAKAVKIVSSRRLLYYDTDEMALQAAERMVSDEVLPLFRSLSVTSDLECTVSGPGVVAPHGSVRVSDDDEFALRHITYTTELKAAASALSPGDAYAGYLLKVVADSAIVAGDDETPEARYYARAALLVSVDKSSYVPVSMNGKPLVDITIDKRLFVPLEIGRAHV